MNRVASIKERDNTDNKNFVLCVNNRTSDSFGKLFILYDKPLIRFSNRYLHCLSDAEDVVQDVFIQFWQSDYTFTDGKSIESFLYTATKNRSLNFLKRNRKLIHNISFLEYETADEPPNNFFDWNYELKSMFESSLGQLPLECKKIMSYFTEGLNSLEIAIYLKIAPSTVRAQKRRGIQILKNIFHLSKKYQEFIS
ncbi:MAG: sigma-70 family RNA polymerase sigma factor [Rikenellaceae bacterium]